MSYHLLLCAIFAAGHSAIAAYFCYLPYFNKLSW